MKELREAGQMGQGSRPCIALSSCLSATLFDLSSVFWFRPFSHYVGPDDNQPVSLSHYEHRCLLTTALKLLLYRYFYDIMTFYS